MACFSLALWNPAATHKEELPGISQKPLNFWHGFKSFSYIHLHFYKNSEDYLQLNFYRNTDIKIPPSTTLSLLIGIKSSPIKYSFLIKATVL